MNIALLLPNWVGDLTMATPAIRALRQHYPTAHLCGVVKPHLIDLIHGTTWFDSLIACGHPYWLGRRGFFSTLTTIRKFKPDLIIGLRGSFRTGLLAWASGGLERVSVGSPTMAKFWHRSVEQAEFPGAKKHGSEVDRYLQTVKLVGADSENRQLELVSTFEGEQLAERFWQRMHLSNHEPVVMINAGTAQSSARMWPLERFAQLSKELVDRYQVAVIVNCGPGEQSLARQIVDLAQRSRVVSLADEPTLSFGLLKALLRRVRLLVTTDSGPRHIAAAMGTAVVAILGATNPDLTHNYNSLESIVRLNLSCSPCHAHHCPLQHLRCLNDLTVAQVLSNVAKLLDKMAQVA